MALDSITIELGVSGENPREVELQPGSYVIGRDSACELFIDDDRISRRHLRLVVAESEFFAEDLDSSNGSYLNGLALCERVPIRAGELLVLGAEAVFVRIIPREDYDTTLATSSPSLIASPDSGETVEESGVDLFQANYEPGRELARGGMGAVIKAEDRNVERQVAIKRLLTAQQLSDDSKQRFLQEARIMGHLEHPNIVPMHELGLDEEGLPYYTMKLVRGTNLQDVVDKIREGDEETISTYPLRALLEIFVKICDALAFAHSKGVVHRDIKPENIMLGEFGEVLVADWGLAKILPETPMAFLLDALAEDSEGNVINDDSEGAAMRTMEGSIMGTPNYMAPEQAKGLVADVDQLSDIFSLGGILYTMLTLRPPVLGATVTEVLDNMKSGYIAPPIFYNKVKSAKAFGRGRHAQEEVALLHCPEQQLPEALSRVTMRAMKLDRKKRYRSVQKLQSDVLAWLHGYATNAEGAGIQRQLSLLIQRNRRAALVAGLVLAVGLVFFSWAVVADYRARSAMDDLQPAVPLIESDLEASSDRGEFDRALERLNSLVKLLPHETQYRIRRAEMLQANFRFSEAVEEFKIAGATTGDRQKFAADVALSESLAGAGNSEGLGDEDFETFIGYLEQRNRFNEARVLRRRRIAEVTERMASKREEFLQLSDEKSAAMQKAISSLIGNGVTRPPEADSFWDFEFDARDRRSNLDLVVSSGAKVENGFLNLTGPDGNATSQPMSASVEEFTIEMWADLELKEAKSATLFWLRSGDNHNALRYNLRGRNQLSYQWRRSSQVNMVGGKSKLSGMTQYVLSVGRDEVKVFVNGRPTGIDGATEKVTRSFFEFPRNHGTIMIGHDSFSEPRHIKGRIAEARFFRRVVSDEEVAALYRSNPLAHSLPKLVSKLPASDQSRIEGIDSRLAGLWKEVVPINRLIASAKSANMLASYRKWMKEQGAPAEACERLEFDEDGGLSLDLRRLKISEIPWLRNIPVRSLDISSIPITDLSPLRGGVLRKLQMRDTKVTRLDPLAGMSLEVLEVDRVPLTDVRPLAGMPLRHVSFYGTRVSDLSPLKGAPLRYLNLGNAIVRDLTPLAGMPIENLIIGGCKGIADLSPLKGMPLVNLQMWSNPAIKDLGPLIDSKLQRIQLGSMSDLVGWTALAGKPLREFHAGYGNLNDYSFLAGAPLESIKLEWTKGNDFSVFRRLQPKKLDLTGCNIRDLRDLGATNYLILNLYSTPVADLTPLEGRRIDNLQLQRCSKIQDLSPLLKCQIRRLVLPPAAKNVEVLRDHPTLQRITWRLPPKYSRLSDWARIKSKEDFWKEWDGGRRKP